MATTYKTDLMPPENVPAYVAAHSVGRQLVLPDLKTPGKSVAYTIQEIRVDDNDDHPHTGDPLKRVTLVLKN
jgi:hypothetical protein